ncbi:regulator of G-protein signaling loco [Aphis craccivora]|uniref:Regulator of G-protein signaling loco n=1 Tax=Aphis craccivora TaxID=307492 RepID=A0A6G0ZP49_APHCR|nr:regulator of G-protein signaling loco [Aphis craccivora]
MHPVRRRKKRPNYGVRMVEVKRGKNGFGFTISGQQPCILSCIVPGSPADQAGLRAGDYLVAVSNHNVSKLLHDDVVQLIGGCQSALRLQIAENYYSDSSDEEFKNELGRQRPKYPHKSRPALTPINVNKMRNDDPDYGIEFAHVSKPCNRNNNNCSIYDKEAVAIYNFQIVVRYLGSIEMPCIPAGSRLQVVKSCIKRLKAEKRSHAAVLMTGYGSSLCLQNNAGVTLAVYPGSRVMFCAASSDENSKYFGVVTISSIDDEPSNSCHVFAVDPVSHEDHCAQANSFKITCVRDSNGVCTQFPPNCDQVVVAIEKYYKNDANRISVVGNSPHPSHDSTTTTTSNSDSGIGYKDYCGMQTDRILMVDVQNQCLHIQQVGEMATHCVDCSDSITPKDTAVERGPRSRSPLSTSSVDLVFSQLGPDYTILSRSPGPRRSKSESSVQHENNSCEGMSLGSSYRSQEILLSDVKTKSNTEFDCLRYPLVTQSLEDFKTNDEDCNVNIWGSLQNIKEGTEDFIPETDGLYNNSKTSQAQDWTLSFERVLQDPITSQNFAEFLKKEFSAENLYFWTACERYHSTIDQELRCAIARDIYAKHLACDAIEPVNVDSKASNLTIEQIEEADPNLFLQAQKQVFNLMKFDSYPRFVKSDLYKMCLVEQIADHIPFSEQDTTTFKSAECSSKKINDVEETTNTSTIDYHVNTGSRRKSLLSWRRQSTVQPPLTSGLCRVTLPDQSSTVLHVTPDITVQVLIQRLFDKRGYPYKHFKVKIQSNNEQIIDLNGSSCVLDGLDVKVEPRIWFRLDLPDRKTINVDCKIDSTIGQEIGPILSSYGYKTELVTLCSISENEVIDPDMDVSLVESRRIQVLTRSSMTSFTQNMTLRNGQDSDNLDDLTNQVFEDLLQNKNPELNKLPSDQGSIKSEEWGSEQSSSLISRFLRRDSIFHEKQRKIKKTCKSQFAIHDQQINSTEKKQTLSKLPPLIAKLKPITKIQNDKQSESDALYEGLKRAQRSRLEDQRGTEINFEMPDFLKNKENNTVDTNKKHHKSIRLTERNGENRDSTRFYKSLDDGEFKRPNPIADDRTKFIRHLPPPLPPKPKNLTNDLQIKKKVDTKTKKPVYVDQPTSSFV